MKINFKEKDGKSLKQEKKPFLLLVVVGFIYLFIFYDIL